MAREFEAEYEAGELEHITEKVRPKGKRKNPSVSPVANPTTPAAAVKARLMR